MLEPQHFSNESLLQDILEKFPEVVALDDLGVTEPFLVIGREVSTDAGSIDVLCIDGDGVLTVIETKLARNSQIRREVVGQVLEYVAQVSNWWAPKVIEEANKYFSKKNINKNLIEYLIESSDQTQEKGYQYFFEKINSNLRNGKIKIVIASDSIPETLRDTVSFINRYSSFDIFVMQVKSYVKDEMRIYAPTIYGLTQKIPTGTERASTQWDEENFFREISQLTQDKIDAIKDLYEFSKASEIKWGTGATYGSFHYVTELEGKKASIFVVNSTGTIEVYFGNLKNIEHKKLLSFRNELKRIKGLSFPEIEQAGGKFPKFNIDLLLNNESMSIFKSAVNELVEQLEAGKQIIGIKEKYDDNKFSGDIEVHFEKNPSKDVTLSEDDERILDKVWVDVAKAQKDKESEQN